MKARIIIMLTVMLTLSALIPSCAAHPSDTDGSSVQEVTSPATTGAAEEVTVPVTTSVPATTAAPIIYYVRTPVQPPEETLKTEVYTYTDYEEACKFADGYEKAALGYAVYGEDGTFLHGKNSEFVTKLLCEAKHVADFMKENKYSYGNAATNPATVYEKYIKRGKLSESIVSCDRYVGWVLYRLGYTDQPSSGGMYVWNNGSDHDLGTYLEKKGFKKVKTKNYEAGDIVFVNLTHTAAGTPYPAHVFICAGSTGRGTTYYRYDAGSQERIRCISQYASYAKKGQPFKEEITNLVYIYRYDPKTTVIN